MNKAILMGRLTKDVELRYTQTGKAVATFTLAVDRKKGENANGPTADFIPCVAWDKLGELAGNYLAKGRQVLVEGRMQVRSYKAKDGSNRYTTEIILEKMEFVGSKSDNENSAGSQGNYGQQGFGFDNVGSDENIPF